MAYTECERRSEMECADERGTPGERPAGATLPRTRRGWPVEPAVGRVVDGLAHRVDRLTALGNGQVPRVACTAWRILSANAKVSGRPHYETEKE